MDTDVLSSVDIQCKTFSVYTYSNVVPHTAFAHAHKPAIKCVRVNFISAIIIVTGQGVAYRVLSRLLSLYSFIIDTSGCGTMVLS